MTRPLKHFHEDLSTGEAATYFGVHSQTIINWCDMGRLNWTRVEKGPRRIPAKEVVEVLKRNKMAVPEELLERARRAELSAAA